MKKIVLSMTAVLAAAAFAPEASAVPVFARQTGMACSACHYQHFPLLNSFGRAFKAGGFTMTGAQGKIEGEHLSIPDQLNMGVLTSSYYQDETGSNKNWGVPGSGGELSIFYGGRISEFAGFLSELGMSNGSGAAQTGAAKEAILFPVGDARVGAVVYSGGQGAAYGFELLNTGAADTHKMMGNGGPNKQHVAATYAGSYLGTRTNATGANIVANNSMGFISVGRYADAGPGTDFANALPLTYARVAAILDIAGWDAGFGLQKFTGDQSTITGVKTVYDATVIDAQMQGEIAGMETGFYVTFGTAPADVNGNAMAAGWSTLAKANGLGNKGLKATSLNLATSVEVIPHVATVQLATRFATLDTTADFTAASGMAASKSYTDNAVMVGLTYELAQNFELAYNYTTQSGSAWDNVTAPVGKTTSTFLVEVLF